MAEVLAGLGIGRLFDVVPDAIVVGDVRSGRVLAWNAAAVELLGWAPEEVVGGELERIVPPGFRVAHRSGIAAFLDDRGSGLVESRRAVEVPAQHRDGHEVWVELRLAPLPDAPHGHVVAVLRDVTLRRQAQIEREQALAESERAHRGLGEFVDALSHDVRSPLAAVQLGLDLLLTRGDRLGEQARTEVLRNAGSAARAAMELVDDLLQVEQLERGHVRPVADHVDLPDAVREALVIAGVEATVEVPADLHLRTDPRMLRRMLVNLLTNATKYGAPPFVVSAHAGGDAVEVAVEDHGRGVPDDVRDVLFERFTRARSARDSAAGLGLGLAIVAGLAVACGGHVRCDDTSHGGARFVLALPVELTT